MKTIAGLGLQGSNLDLEAAVALGVKDFLLLEPGGIQGGDLQRIIELVPGARIALRLYSPNRMSQAPAEAATYDYLRIMAATTAEQRQHIHSVSPGNELNLDVEHQGDVPYPDHWKSIEGYENINRWLLIWADSWRDMAANDFWRPKLAWPALSPGNNPPDRPPESEYELLRTSIAAFNTIDIHVYGNADPALRWHTWVGAKRLGRIVAKLESLGLGDKPRNVTEVNQVNFAEFCIYASSLGIDTAYWFLWRSAGLDHRRFDLKPPWDIDLKEYIRQNGGEPMPEPTTSPTIEDLLTDMWIRAGVVPNKATDAMWRYCLDLAQRGTRAIVPLPSTDGNYQNWGDRYVVGYTSPIPLYMEQGVWEVHEGFPPQT